MCETRDANLDINKVWKEIPIFSNILSKYTEQHKVTVMPLDKLLLSNYRFRTAQGLRSVASSFEKLGYLETETIIVAPALDYLEKFTENKFTHELPENVQRHEDGWHHADPNTYLKDFFVVIDGNHRLQVVRSHLNFSITSLAATIVSVQKMTIEDFKLIHREKNIIHTQGAAHLTEWNTICKAVEALPRCTKIKGNKREV